MNREEKIKQGKLRGGRPTKKFRNKRKYNRKKKNKYNQNELDSEPKMH